MADKENNNQEETRRRAAENEQREEQKREASKRDGAKGGLKFSNDPDPRSKEEQLADIEAHNKRTKEAQDEALEEQLSNYNPEKLGHRIAGGIDIIDTRNARSRLSRPAVNDPNLSAKRQIAEENREFRPGLREESQTFNRNSADQTARAEVIARR